MLNLRDRVAFTPPRGFRQYGEVRGVSRMAQPKYDILADDGVWHSGLPADCVELMKEEAA